MKIFALSDPHLSLTVDKPMDIFGDNWSEHGKKIKEGWTDVVSNDDVVLVAGDISWALKINDAAEDLAFLRELPGRKVLLKGNHDYWWAGLKKVREAAGEGFDIIQNNSVVINGIGISGSRLWNYPFVKWPFSGEGVEAKGDIEIAETSCASRKDSGKHGDVDDEKVCRSEVGRLKNSLRTIPEDVDLRICMTHFPPISAYPENNQLTAIIAANNIDYAVYGHLHALDRDNPYPAVDCTLEGVRYLLSSSDWLDFVPKLVVEV